MFENKHFDPIIDGLVPYVCLWLCPPLFSLKAFALKPKRFLYHASEPSEQNFAVLRRAYNCVSRLNVTPVFFVFSLMTISIEKEITKMNLDVDRVIRLFFSLKYDLLYRLGLDGISACKTRALSL